MTPEFWAAIIGQTVVLVATIVAAFIRTEKRITKVETEIRHLEQETDKIAGISRALARLEGPVLLPAWGLARKGGRLAGITHAEADLWSLPPGPCPRPTPHPAPRIPPPPFALAPASRPRR